MEACIKLNDLVDESDPDVTINIIIYEFNVVYKYTFVIYIVFMLFFSL